MSIRENLHDIQERIATSASLHGRSAKNVKLIAVSKNQSPEIIDEALKAGHRIFGENRVQEAQTHWQDLRRAYPDLQLHLIGPLQTNKVRDAVALFDMIHTLDRAKLADALAAEMEKQNKNIPCFIQVNTGGEEQKSGVAVEALPALLAYACSHNIEVKGLMCIPPIDEPPAMHFALLHKLAQRHNLKELSMGMSHDYEQAVALGATCVRVGTAIFGART